MGVDPFDPAFGFGRGEIDTLEGGQGSDTFLLGNANHIFYNGEGTSNAAIIVDFNPNEDFIQLKSLDNASYVLAPGSSSASGTISTELFLDRPNEPLELIANLQGVTNLNLNDNYFIFV